MKSGTLILMFLIKGLEVNNYVIVSFHRSSATWALKFSCFSLKILCFHDIKALQAHSKMIARNSNNIDWIYQTDKAGSSLLLSLALGHLLKRFKFFQLNYLHLFNLFFHLSLLIFFVQYKASSETAYACQNSNYY